MTEALQAVIANAQSVTSALSAGSYNNPISKHLLEKFGFKIVDTLKGIQRRVDDQPHDEPYYILNL